jgi:hypothetical protein
VNFERQTLGAAGYDVPAFTPMEVSSGLYSEESIRIWGWKASAGTELKQPPVGYVLTSGLNPAGIESYRQAVMAEAVAFLRSTGLDIVWGEADLARRFYLVWLPAPSHSYFYAEQVRSMPITAERTEKETFDMHKTAAAKYRGLLTTISNLSDLSGLDILVFLRELKKYPLYSVSLFPTPVSRLAALAFPDSTIDFALSRPNPTIKGTLYFEERNESLSVPGSSDVFKGRCFLPEPACNGYSDAMNLAYIMAIESMFAENAVARSLAEFQKSEFAKTLTDQSLLIAAFSDLVNELHNIDDAICEPINVTVVDISTNAPLADFQISIPVRIPDTRPAGYRNPDGWYYPRARIKEIYRGAMEYAKNHIFVAAAEKGIDLPSLFRFPIAEGYSLAKIDIPKFGLEPENPLKKFGVLATLAAVGGYFLAQR